MNFKFKKLTAILLVALQPLSGIAATTGLANSPLSNTGSTSVRPNIMMIFDTSGSMGWTFTPDYVDDSNKCVDAGDDINNTPDGCVFGDPPHMSPDFNSQYYNPAFRYRPALNADGTEKMSYTAANSSNWTVVPLDAFGKMSASNANIASGYKDRIWCKDPDDVDDSNGAKVNCRVNETDGAYPEVIGSAGSGIPVYTYGKTSGGTVRYRNGPPYYYTITPTEYCTSTDFKTCKPLLSPGTGPDAAFVYPAKVRFCRDATLTDCQAKYKDSSPTYTYPKYIGVYAAGVAANAGASATGTLTVNSVSNGANVTSLVVNGYEFGPLTLNTNNTSTAASGLAALINAQSGTTGFNASASSNNISLTAATPGTAWNSKSFSANSATTVSTYPVYTFSVSGVVTNRSNSLASATINGVNILTNSVSVTNPANTKVFCDAIYNRIDTSKFSRTACTATSTSTMTVTALSSTLGANPTMSSWNTAPTLGARSRVTMTASNSTPGVVAQAQFKANGGAAGTSVSGTTASGVNPVVGSNPGRVGSGTWQKTYITSTNNSYPKSVNRDDCVGTTCTYDEEMTNFANWHAYYRTRNQSMKSAVGRAFSQLNDNYRVGLVDIYTTNLSSTTNFLAVNPFTPNSGHRTSWYTKLYNMPASGGTPLRQALYTVGEYYKGTSAAANDPMEYSCQQNYSFLATDGYWNGGAWSTIGNEDNVDSGYSKRADGAYDGALGSSTSTLADVAMYFYKNDLRTTGALATNNVPTTAKDKNAGQHMVTFTMGLGVDGLMQYSKDYDSINAGDYYSISTGATGCSWVTAGSTCNWPVPAADSQTAVDDLWHAAVNGRGKYYSAKSPQDASEGLNDALNQIQQITGSAAASATSSPNITPTDNSIYSSTYQTLVWDGEVVKQRIDPSTGAILPYDSSIDWMASQKVSAQADLLASGTAGARNLHTYDLTAGGTDKLKDFDYSSLSVSEQAYFNGKCTAIGGFAQCATMNSNRKVEADKAENLVNYLRGFNTNNAFTDNSIPYGYLDIFRSTRTNRLGDTVNATPVYVRQPQFNFNYTTGGELYADFKANNGSRSGVLYIAANDGYLHAFNGSNGNELWAYTPRIIMPNLYKLADESYASNHQYFVDGSPTTMDVYDSTAASWKTVLVGGLNHGGQGYYALDITNTSAPRALWEVCSDNTNCSSALKLPDLGYTYGNPVITRLPDGNANAGKWVVLLTSGYNNVIAAGSTGIGKMFVLDVMTGALLDTYSTNVGTLASPSGLSKLSAVAANFYYDGKSTVAYGGDLLGNVWRFDLTKAGNASGAVEKIGVAKDATGVAQPITTKIEIGAVPNTTDKPLLMFGTGKYLGSGDLSDTQGQTVYAIKDPFTTGGLGTTYSDLRDVSSFVENTILDSGGIRTVNANPVNWTTDNGWFVDLPDSGERVNLDPQLNLGTLLIGANVVNPSISNACSVGGYSYLYQFDYASGSYISTATANAVAKKNNNALLVGNVVVKLPSGVMKVITTSATGGKTVDALFTSGSSASGTRISWRELPL